MGPKKEQKPYLLFKQLCQGSNAAAKKFCTIARPVLRKLINSNRRTHLNADDLTQEVFVHIFGKCGKYTFESQKKLEGMIWEIGAKQLIKKIERDRLTFPEKKEYTSELHIDEQEDNMNSELILLMWKNIHRLPKSGQRIIKLFYMEGLSLEEIAAKLKHKSAESTKAMKSKYMKQLRNLCSNGQSNKK